MSNASLIFFLGVIGFCYWKLKSIKRNEKKKKYVDEILIGLASFVQICLFISGTYIGYVLVERAATNSSQQQEIDSIQEAGKDYH